MRCMKVVLPDPAMPTQTMATGPLVDGDFEDRADFDRDDEAGVVVAMVADVRACYQTGKLQCSLRPGSGVIGKRSLSESIRRKCNGRQTLRLK